MRAERRHFLKSAGAVFVLLVAGCTDNKHSSPQVGPEADIDDNIDAKLFPTNIDATIISADSTIPIDSETTTLVNL